MFQSQDSNWIKKLYFSGFIKLVNTYDSFFQWYYFSYHVTSLTVCLLLLLLTNIGHLTRFYRYVKTSLDAIRLR